MERWAQDRRNANNSARAVDRLEPPTWSAPAREIRMRGSAQRDPLAARPAVLRSKRAGECFLYVHAI
jgi:hypothetical protein